MEFFFFFTIHEDTVSGTEILLTDTRPVSYVAYIITTHRIQLWVFSVYLTPLLSCIGGIVWSWMMKRKCLEDRAKSRSTSANPKGLPDTPRRSVIRFSVHAQHYFFHFLLLICPRCPCLCLTKDLPHFPHYRFLVFSATLDAHHPRTEQVLRTWKSTAALVYGLAFHLTYFKSLMKVAVVKSWWPTEVKCLCLVRYYVSDAFLFWPFLFVTHVHWWLRVRWQTSITVHIRSYPVYPESKVQLLLHDNLYY